jgi:hypothetical protein
MDLMINQPQPNIQEKRELFQPWVIPINILQKLRYSTESYVYGCYYYDGTYCHDDYDNWVLLNAQVLTDITVKTKGNIIDGILADNINNSGIIPQVKVQSGAVVNGGKLTGYANNKRILSNFELVGAKISGGTLTDHYH